MTSMQHGMLWSPFNARCMLLRSLADFRSLVNFQYTTQKITRYTGKPSIIFPVIFYVSSLLNEMFSVSLLFLGVMDVHIAQVYFRSASGSWRGFSATQATEVSLLQFERDARQPPRADRDKTEPCRSQYNTVSRRMTHRFDLCRPPYQSNANVPCAPIDHFFRCGRKRKRIWIPPMHVSALSRNPRATHHTQMQIGARKDQIVAHGPRNFLASLL